MDMAKVVRWVSKTLPLGIAHFFADENGHEDKVAGEAKQAKDLRGGEADKLEGERGECQEKPCE